MNDVLEITNPIMIQVAIYMCLFSSMQCKLSKLEMTMLKKSAKSLDLGRF